MKKNKLLAGIMAAAMMLCLAGCQSGPTAEDLLESARSIDWSTYYQMDVKMDMETTGGEESASVTLDAKMEGNKDIQHLYDCSMEIGSEGFTLGVDMETWTDIANKMAYANFQMFGYDMGWVKAAIEQEDDPEISETLMGVTDDILGSVSKDGATLAEHEKGSDYVVTWAVDAANAEELLGVLTETVDDRTLGEGVTMKDTKAEARFDEETRTLKSLSLETGASMDAEDGESADTTLTFAITINEVGGDKALEVPEEVISTATESAEVDLGSEADIEIGDEDTQWNVYEEPDMGDVLDLPSVG